MSFYAFERFASEVEAFGRDLGYEPEYEGGTWAGRFQAGTSTAELESIHERSARLTLSENDMLLRTMDIPMTMEGARTAAACVAPIFQFARPDPFEGDDTDKRLCPSCVSDYVLIKRIEDEGQMATCTYCHKRNRVVSISQVAEWINDVYIAHAQEADEGTSFFWPSEGKTPSEILYEDLGINDETAVNDLVEYLHDTYVRRRPEEPDYYDKASDAYKLHLPYSPTHVNAWEEFTTAVKHRSRFFNEHHESYLRKIFDPLLDGSLTKGVPPIVEIGPGTTIAQIYRGREAGSTEALKKLYGNPAREFGAPPPMSRRQGRMNAAGISVFYGSTDVKTCVAELRPAVGSNVVVATFNFLRTVQLLDFRQLAGSTMPFSWFDSNASEKAAYVEFMRRLHDELRKPVLPGAEALEYLPTQIISEYLATRTTVGLDGIVFTSSLTSRLRDEDEDEDDDDRLDEDETAVEPKASQIVTSDAGLNVVLFAHAAEVDLRGAPAYVIGEISFGRVKRQVVEATPITDRSQLAQDHPVRNAESTASTLRIALDKPLKFVRVRAIDYDLDSLDVSLENPRDYPPF